MGFISRLRRMFGKKPVVLPPDCCVTKRPLTIAPNPVLARRIPAPPAYVPPKPYRRPLVVEREVVREKPSDDSGAFVAGLVLGNLLSGSSHAHTEDSPTPVFTGGDGESSGAGASSSWEPRESGSSSDSYSSSSLDSSSSDSSSSSSSSD